MVSMPFLQTARFRISRRQAYISITRGASTGVFVIARDSASCAIGAGALLPPPDRHLHNLGL
jgi:hypothetical protein